MARRLLGRTSVRDALDSAGIALGAAGCDSPRLDAELLLAHVLGVGRAALIASPGRELEPDEARAFMDLAARRRGREPVAYILGSKGFRTIDLAVDARVLVPRPETEHVVEAALALPPGARVADVGTGSGAIALALADEHPGARVVALDLSPDALSLARENVERTGLGDRVELRQGDLVDGVRGPFDLVVSNPPYVRADELSALQPEVRDWEPQIALVGDGLTEAIAAGARRILRPGGALVLEVAENSAQRVAAELRRLGYEDVGVTLDLSGRDRVVEGRAALTSA
jgi:release factor glutamine methyltransferase